jgi:hypothetical protein
MEKANMAINMLLLEARLHELRCVVVDEAHMVSDKHRYGARVFKATLAKGDTFGHLIWSLKCMPWTSRCQEWVDVY